MNLKNPFVIALAFACSMIGLLWSHTAADPDLFARVAVGRAIALTSWVVPHDPFSFMSRDAVWVDHEWLSGLLFYQMAQMGDAAIWWGKWLLFSGFVFILAAVNRRKGEREFLLSMAIGVFGCLYVWLANIRCQIFTYLSLLLLLGAIAAFERYGKRGGLRWLPLLFCLWCNLHGGWTLGLLALTLYSLTRAVQKPKDALFLFSICCFCLLSTLINPWGIAYWSYLIDALSMSRPHIIEWQAVSPFSPLGAILVATFFLSLLGGREYRARLPELLLFMASFGIALTHLRLVAFYFLVLSVFYSHDLLNSMRKVAENMIFAAEKIASACTLLTRSALVLGCALFVFELSRGFHGLDYSSYPVKAVDWALESGYQGRLLLGFNQGSYALWRLFPRFQVSVDGRFEEVYDTSVVDRNRCALSSACPEQQRSLEAIRPDLILAQKGHFGLPQGMSYDLAYEDDRYLLFVRSGLKPAAEPGKIADIWQATFVARDLFLKGY